MSPLSNGDFTIRRITRAEPYEPGTDVQLGTVRGLLSEVSTEAVTDGRKVVKHVRVATLSIGPDETIGVDCEVDDPWGNTWRVRSIGFAQGFGLSRQIVKLVEASGAAS